MSQFAFYSDKGITYNEDFVYTNGEFGFVLDGATGMNPEKIAVGNSDAQVLSHGLGKYLMTRLGDTDKTIAAILEDGISEIRDCFPDYQTQNNVYLPSCTFACFRKNADKMEIAWLGDSPIIVVAEGKTSVYYDETIENMDQAAITKYVEYLTEGGSAEDARKKVHGILYNNRQQKNQLGGYWILDLPGEGLSHLYEKSFSLNKVEQILICSDGFYRIFDLFKLANPETDLINFTDYATIISQIDALRGIENQENSLVDYPRLKVSDDASVLSVRFDC